MIEFIKTVFGECGIRTRFGIYCPGCGGTRAVEAFLSGEILQSLKFNPIVLLFLADIVLTIAVAVVGVLKKERNYKISRIILVYNWAILAFFAIYFVLRNVLLVKFGVDMLGDFL